MKTSVSATIRALAGSATDWLSGRWPGQEALLDAVAARTGFSTPVVRAGLDAHLAAMNEVALTAWYQRSGTIEARPGETWVVILAADNIPGVALAPTAAALLAGCRVTVKLPADGEPFTTAWLAAVKRRNAATGGRLSTVTFKGGHSEGDQPLADADVLIVMGEDATIATLELRSPGRVIGMGTGWSFAVVDEVADLDEAARELARDVALWDQAGCLSPRGCWFVGTADAARAFVQRLAIALESIERSWPARARALGEDAHIRHFRAELDATAAAGLAVEWRGPAEGSTAWTAWFEPTPFDGLPEREPELRSDRVGDAPRGADHDVTPSARLGTRPGHRSIWVRPVPSFDTLVQRIGASPGWPLQGAGLVPGSGVAFDRMAAALRSAGVPHVVPLGRLQVPPIDWPNKGRDLLADLSALMAGRST